MRVTLTAPAGRRRRLVAASIAAAASIALASTGNAIGDEPAGTDIVGGSSTSIEEWPWQVALAAPPARGGDGYQRLLCGGSLVSRTAVLTAAHCVHDGQFQSAGEFSVITGRGKLSSDAGAEIPVSEIFYFVDSGGVPRPQSQAEVPAGAPLYDPGAQRWDVAVIELSRPAPAPAAPIQIANEAERSLWEPGDTVFATGWGDTTGVGGNYPDELREVELDVISDPDCGDATSYGTGFDPSTMVCAGNPPVGGKDTCQGDSGGPLVAPAGDGSFRLIGDTSFGDGCGLPEKYGVYGRVAGDGMRPALLEAIGLAVGGPPASPASAADRTRPETRLHVRPAKRSRSKLARFRWKASESSSFRCRIDRGRAQICRSPFTKRVAAGRHTFSVVATDSDGNRERRGPSYSWRVVKKKRG